MTTPITSYTLIKPLFPVTHMFIGYNYGLYTQEYRGYRIVGHEGSVGGFQTLIWTFPDANVGFFGRILKDASDFLDPVGEHPLLIITQSCFII